MSEPRNDNVATHKLSVRVAGAINDWFCGGYHEVAILTPNTLPPSGRAIVAANHTAGIDPLLVQKVCPRLIRWMMAREYYNLPVLNFLFRAIQAIPVDRDGRDMSATRAALRVLQDEGVLGIFPEGKWSHTRELLPFQSGIAMLAIRTGAPVFPVYLDGTMRGREMVPSLLRRCSATVAFGPAVEFDRKNTSREGLEATANAIRDSVCRLQDLCTMPQRGV